MIARYGQTTHAEVKQFILRGAASCAIALCAAMSSACESPADDAPTSVQSAAIPLAGLSDAARKRFQQGVSEFSDVEGTGEGLGPLFNGSSCAGCHNTPMPGGAGLMRVTRVYCKDAAEPQNTLVHLFSTRPDLAAATVPRACEAVVAQRRTTSLMGAGLIEAIPDSAIEALAAQQPSQVAGRPAHVKDLASGKMRVGHFGWKAQHATLESFAGDAYLNEMGITNRLFPEEVAPNGDAGILAAMDPTPDPEAEVGSLEQLADFMRLLAAPNAQAGHEEGAALFDQLGCETCHHASFHTASPEPVLDAKEVLLYSDLLLHDVGTGDGIAQGDASDHEIRTPPLWGVRHSQLWLHDGRAASLDEAIRMHAGQALAARQAYEQLQPGDRKQLIAFLNGL